MSSKNLSNHYKMLPLDFPFDLSRRMWGDCVEERYKTEPVFNRNGYYLDRYFGVTWLEINGEAWLYGSREDFQYRLDHSDGNNRIHDDLYKAIGVVIKNRLSDKKLKKLYDIETQMRMLREITISSSIAGMKMRERFKKFKEERGLS